MVLCSFILFLFHHCSTTSCRSHFTWQWDNRFPPFWRLLFGCPLFEHQCWQPQVKAFVEEASPDLIWPIWNNLNPVERADVFRYLVIYQKGGYYADLDVSCSKAIREYPVPKDASMIVGYQTGYRMTWKKLQASPQQRLEQFEQWFFASAPKNPILLRTLETWCCFTCYFLFSKISKAIFGSDNFPFYGR